MRLDENGDAIICPRCDGDEVVRSGRIGGKQRYQCKGCSFHFIPTAARRMSSKEVEQQRAAILMYLSGAQQAEIQVLFGRSYPVIKRWLEPVKEMLEGNERLNSARRPRTVNVATIKSMRELPKQSGKRWLVIEMDEDFFNGRTVAVTKGDAD